MHTLILSGLLVVIVSNSLSAQQKAFIGTWESIGYGWRMEIGPRYTTWSHITRTSSVRDSKFLTRRIISQLKLNGRKDTLSITEGQQTYYFTNSVSASKENKKGKSPLENFDVLWNTFHENYCSFELRNINWQQIGDMYRRKITNETTPQELFLILKDMLSELHDGHVSIEPPRSFHRHIEDPDKILGPLRQQAIEKTCNTYLKKYYTYNHGAVNWGLIDTNIAYLQINDLETLANYGIDKNLPSDKFQKIYTRSLEKSGDPAGDVVDGTAGQMKKIFSEIQNVPYCIIDLRFNGGGLDQAGLAILAHLFSEKRNVYSKQARFENGFTRECQYPVIPAAPFYRGQVYILTSPLTASAAEVFVLASMNLPNVVRIGSNTEGIFSDILEKKLPNGWRYSLSNEVYRSSTGENFEKTGIPPHHAIPYDREQQKFLESILHEPKGSDQAVDIVLKDTHSR